MKKWTVILSALMLSMTACTAKKRDSALPYGADRNLLKISDFDGAEFDVVTDGLQAKSSSNSADVKILDETGNVQFHDFVTYQTKADLLDNSPFLGKPSTTYKVKYIFDDKKLKIYKVGQEKDFSYEEKSAAQSMHLADGRLAAPLVAYSVSYYTTENSRNENNETTHKLELVDQDAKSKSDYFRVDKSSKELAEFLKKDLTFGSKFFDGKWYFATSIVSQNYKLKGDLDRTVLEWISRSDSAKVEVKKEENRISFYGLNIDAQLKSNLSRREENQNVVLSFAAAWKDYRMAPSGRGTSVREQEDLSRAWDQRSHVKIDLTKISMPTLNFKKTMANEELEGLNIKPEVSAEIRDVQIGEQLGRRYFSFLVYTQESKALVRYAFLEAKDRNDVKPYEAKTYLKDDRKVFGYFSTDTDSLLTRDKMNEADHLNTHMINRFNPALKIIQFNPSEQTPDWALRLAEKATRSWNDAFKKAGTATQIEFAAKKVPVGDLRYNVINIVNDPDGGDPWWGFGPSVADLETGEIISATANVNISDMTQYVRTLIKSYIRNRAGETSSNYLGSAFLANANVTAKSVNGALVLSGETQDVFSGIELSNLIQKNSLPGTQYLPLFDRSLDKGYQWTQVSVSKKSGIFGSSYNGRAPEGIFQLEYENITREIQEKKDCVDLKAYLDEVEKSRTRRSMDEENKTIETCTMAILEPRVINTIIHEMGHNFGLRHNFYGNTDAANFWPGASGKLPARSSSIMEYPHFDEITLVTPGYYDVAAIKWGYTEKLLARDGGSDVTNYSPKLPITAQPAAAQMRHFKFCTDEEASLYGGFDPMCARHDKGTTAVETVSSYIKSYNYSLAAYRNLEKGRILQRQAEEYGLANTRNVFIPIKKFYDYFRLLIEAEQSSGGYLENEDEKSFSTLIAEITRHLQAKAPGIKIDFERIKDDELVQLIAGYYKTDLNRDERKFIEFLDYKAASEVGYKFLKSVAFMPDYYCVVKNESNPETPVKLISFAVLQRDVFNSTGSTATSCMQPEVRSFVEATGGSIVLEVGLPVNSLLRNLDTTKSSETPIALGTIYDRGYAMMTLGMRNTLLEQSSRTNLHPNFFDEPEKRTELETLIVDRIIEGVDSKSLNISTKLKELGIKDFKSLNFETEKPLLNMMFSTMVQAQMIPGKIAENRKRLQRFRLEQLFMSEQSKLPGIKIFSMGGVSYYALPENEIIYNLIDPVQNLLVAKETRIPDDAVFDSYRKFVEERIVSNKNPKAKFTVAELLKLIDDIEEAKLETASSKNVKITSIVLKPEFQIIKKVLQPMYDEITSAPKSDEEKKKLVEEFRKIDLIQLSKTKNFTFDLYKETLPARLAVTKKTFTNVVQYYKENQNELGAQTDVLIDALTILR